MIQALPLDSCRLPGEATFVWMVPVSEFNSGTPPIIAEGIHQAVTCNAVKPVLSSAEVCLIAHVNLPIMDRQPLDVAMNQDQVLWTWTSFTLQDCPDAPDQGKCFGPCNLQEEADKYITFAEPTQFSKSAFNPP